MAIAAAVSASSVRYTIDDEGKACAVGYRSDYDQKDVDWRPPLEPPRQPVLIDRHGNMLLMDKSYNVILDERDEPLLAAGASLHQLPMPKTDLKSFQWRPWTMDPWEMEWLPPPPFTRPVIHLEHIPWDRYNAFNGWAASNVDTGEIDMEMALNILIETIMKIVIDELSWDFTFVLALRQILVRIMNVALAEVKEELKDASHMALMMFIRGTIIEILNCMLPSNEFRGLLPEHVREGNKRMIKRRLQPMKEDKAKYRWLLRKLIRRADYDGRHLVPVRIYRPWEKNVIGGTIVKLSDRWFLDETNYEKISTFLATSLTLANVLIWPDVMFEKMVDSMPALLLDSLSHVLFVRHELRAAIGIAAAEVLVWAVPYTQEVMSQLPLREQDKSNYMTEMLSVLGNQVMARVARRVDRTASRIIQELMFELALWREQTYRREDILKERIRIQEKDETYVPVPFKDRGPLRAEVLGAKAFVDRVRRTWSEQHAVDIIRHIRRTLRSQRTLIAQQMMGLPQQPELDEWGDYEYTEMDRRTIGWFVAKEDQKRFPFIVMPIVEALLVVVTLLSLSFVTVISSHLDIEAYKQWLLLHACAFVVCMLFVAQSRGFFHGPFEEEDDYVQDMEANAYAFKMYKELRIQAAIEAGRRAKKK